MTNSQKIQLIKKVLIPYYEKNKVNPETLQDKVVLDGFIEADRLLMTSISIHLGAAEALLYIVLLGHKNNTTNKCCPSITTLSLETGLARNTIEKYISELTEKGYLLVDSGNSYGATNNYYFPCEDNYEVPEIVPHKRQGRWKPSENNNNKNNFDYFKSLLNASQTEEEKES